MAKAGVAQNMTAEKKKSCALMVSRNPSFRTTAQLKMGIVQIDLAAYYCAPPNQIRVDGALVIVPDGQINH
jgi:hypothetical protein